ncbi:MAG: histidine kinase [Lachnospiraceae bacterium]|nr:histidine kinase [Lachnospiraceae bacterium]
MHKRFARFTESFSGFLKAKDKTAAKRKLTLRQELLRLLLLGWFIPLTVLILILFFQGRRTVNRNTDTTLIRMMDKAAQLSRLSIDDCIRESKDASYNSTVRTAREEYMKNGDAGKLRSSVTRFLEEEYKFDTCFNRTVLVFTSEPEKIYYTQNDSIKLKQVPIGSFQEDVLPELLSSAETTGTGVTFMPAGGRVYMIRNIVDNHFVPYSVIIMELNMEEIFKGLYSIPEFEAMTIFCNGTGLYATEPEKEAPAGTEAPAAAGPVLLKRGPDSYISFCDKIEGNEFLYMIRYDRSALLTEWNSMKYLFALMFVSLAVLAAVVFLFMNDRISSPVLKLKEAAGSISEGKYGETISSQGQNTEIAELTESFNRMSVKLNEQFNRIFLEEIALRDANIHALQSQINPHFLNNTLEIINWEARLAGNEKASRMIEALSTMMEATTNRDKRSLIPLSEELSYVHAYIYIIECRYGDRFKYEEEAPGELLSIKVPRLIIQPVMENAVKYGVDSRGNRYVGLFITDEGSSLRLCIVNHGRPGKDEEKHIRELLSFSGETGKGAGIGIQNVDRRLKILYGEPFGLSFSISSDGDTIFTILVKKEQNEQFI